MLVAHARNSGTHSFARRSILSAARARTSFGRVCKSQGRCEKNGLVRERKNGDYLIQLSTRGLLSALTLLELAKVAEARDDPMAYARYISYMLRLFPTTTSAKTQKDLASLLLSHTSRLLPSVSMDMTGLPLVASIKIVPASNVVRNVVSSTKEPVSNGSGVFIFNPAAAKASGGNKWDPAVWVCGEVATARVTLVNERDFSILIERIRLCTHGVAFDAFTSSLNVPAKSTKVVDLSGVPIGQAGRPFLFFKKKLLKQILFVVKETFWSRVSKSRF